MVCLGFEQWTAGWWAQTKPWSQYSRPKQDIFYVGKASEPIIIISRLCTSR